MKKRTILSYLFTFAVIIFSFSAVYYFDYSRLKRQEKQNQETQSKTAQTDFSSADADSKERTCLQNEPNRTTSDSLPGKHNSDQGTSEENLSANAKNQIRTNSSMVYVVGQYDWATGKVTETVSKFPPELLNLTRQELLIFLREHPDYGTLLSFSEHSVYLQKNHDSDGSEYAYYLILEENGLMVYYPDQAKLYLDTGIMPDELREEDRELLSKGFYVKSTADLFDFLQTVTS